MEGGIEDSNLGNPNTQQSLCRADAFQVGRVMEGGEVNAVLDARNYFVGDEDGFPEALSSVDDSMTDGVNLGGRVQDSTFIVEPGDGSVNGLLVIANGGSFFELGPVIGLELQ